MKHTTKLFLIFISLIACMVMPVNATVYENMFDSPEGLGYYGSDSILVSEGTSPSNIVVFDTTGTGSASTYVMNITNYVEDACIGYEGDIYFVLTDGRVYRFFGGYGLFDFVDDYNTSFQLLGDVDALSHDRDIVVDGNGHLYVNSDDSIYKFNCPSFSKSLYESGIYVAYPEYTRIYALAIHPNGVLAASSETETSITTTGIYLIDDSGKTLIYPSGETGGGVADYVYSGMYATTTGDIYAERSDLGASSQIIKLNYSDSYNVSIITGITETTTGMHIDADGIIYLSHTDNTIATYSTTDLTGGYSYAAYTGATGEQQLDYDVSILNSIYEAYNNDSVVELVYNIDVDRVQGLTTQPFLSDDGYPNHYYIVDVLDADGIKQKSSIINTYVDEYHLSSGWHAVYTGTLTYSANPWKNGTWSAVLYEYDISTGLRASLDSCEYEIYEQVSDTTITDETPGVDPTLDPVSRVDALLESNAFIGLLIILACIGAFGKVGGIVGVVLGTVAGISLATLLGYIPGWIMFVMIMALCVVFTSKLIGVFGGGNE